MNTLDFNLTDASQLISLETEEMIIGGLLLDPAALEIVIDKLPSEAFYAEVNRKLYQAIYECNKKYGEYDINILYNFLEDKGISEKIGGKPNLVKLLNKVVTTANIDTYCEQLIDKWIRRRSYELGHEVKNLAVNLLGDTSTLLERIETDVKELTDSEYRDRNFDRDYLKYKKLIEQIKEIEKYHDQGFKYYKKLLLSQETKQSVRQLEQLYDRYLANTEIERSLDFEELKERYGDDVNSYFLHGLIPKGSMILLHALGGKGKTRYCYDLLYRLARGEPLSDFYPTASSRRCMIVQSDESPGDMLRALEDRGFTADMPIRYKTKWLADHFEDLRSEIEEHQPELILIDSLTGINRNSRFTENDTEYARPVLKLRDLAQEYGCTIMLIHHSNGEGGSRGTKAIFNSVSEVWHLEGDNKRDDDGVYKRFITIEKSRSRRPDKLTLSFDPLSNEWGVIGQEIELDGQQATVSLLSYTERQIVDFLREKRGTAFEAAELSHYLEATTKWIRECANNLAQQSIIGRRRSQIIRNGRPATVYFMDWDDPQKQGEINYFRNSKENDFRNSQKSTSEIPKVHTEGVLPTSESQKSGVSEDFRKSTNKPVENSQDVDHTPNTGTGGKGFGNAPPSESANFSETSKTSESAKSDFRNFRNSEQNNESPTVEGFNTTSETTSETSETTSETTSLTSETSETTSETSETKKPWGTENDLPPEQIDKLVTRYLYEYGCSEEFDIICAIDQKSPAVRNALERVAVLSHEQKQGIYTLRFWELP